MRKVLAVVVFALAAFSASSVAEPRSNPAPQPEGAPPVGCCTFTPWVPCCKPPTAPPPTPPSLNY